MSSAVNTAKASRRQLRFDTIDHALAEAARLAALQKAGTAQYAGNWEVSQMLNHVAAWAEYAYKPNPMRAPWFVKLLVKPMKNKFFNNGLPSGRIIPNIPGGTSHIEKVPIDDALDRFHKIFTRLKAEPPTHPSPVFGMMTHEEGIKLNLRHAELHMSFVRN